MGYKTAFINSFGEVVSVVNTGLDDLYVNGQNYGDLTAIHIDDTINPDEFIRSKYYDLDAQVFGSRPERPSEFHDWSPNEKIWKFNFERAMQWVRAERNRLLLECDWTQGLDSPLSDEVKGYWRSYRQALRNLPLTIPTDITSIDEIQWPISHEG
jgi:hypothetical protein